MMDEEKAVLDLNNAWNQAYRERDIIVLDKILADDWMCIDGSGERIGKNDLLERIRLSPGFLQDSKFDETRLRMAGDAAIITGRLSGIMKDEDGTFDLAQRFMRVFAKRGGEWKAIATQVTVVNKTRI
jgi:ketosteroid isomerase-like protein